MSSDNFWYVKGNKVYMGDASDYGYFQEQAMNRFEKWFKARLAKKHPYHEAESHQAATAWAHNEYSEYGVYWIDEDEPAPGSTA